MIQCLIHTSGCPVRHHFPPSFRVRFTMGRYPTSLTLPSRPSLPKAWPTIPPHYVYQLLSFLPKDLKESTYRLVLYLVGYVIGHWKGVCFMCAVGLDVFVVHSSPLPFILVGISGKCLPPNGNRYNSFTGVSP